MFLTAGYPTLDATADLVCALEDGGADIVEIGVPFSDPLADGPVIQKASGTAIANGVTLPWILRLVSQIRKRTDVPLVLMGYLNPIMRYGVDRFFVDAAGAGVDGLILPELPLEEWSSYAPVVASAGLAGILLATPTTPPARVRAIDAASSGFVYCVSTTGVTGGAVAGSALDNVRAVRAHVTRNPMLVGFGISRPEDAVTFARYRRCDRRFSAFAPAGERSVAGWNPCVDRGLPKGARYHLIFAASASSELPRSPGACESPGDCVFYGVLQNPPPSQTL